MPRINTHLHLALKLSKKIYIENINSFYLGNAFPDSWNTSIDQSMQYHYKKEINDLCDLESFKRNEEDNDFNLGYYFHLWIDNRILEVDTKDINKYDCMICDMQVILPMIEQLKQFTYEGKELQAMNNILSLESEPMPLYLVSNDKKQRYEEILDMLVDEFIENIDRWKIIGELTDKDVLGTDGLSSKKPRKTSRAILINDDGKYAVMYSKKFNLHSLPGGGIDDGEDEISALIREVLEETGCTCDEIKPLGIVLENRYHADFTSLSYYFVVNTKTKQSVLHLTESEIENGTILKWCSLEEMIHLIKDIKHDTNQRKFLQARDLLAINRYKSLYDNQ